MTDKSCDSRTRRVCEVTNLDTIHGYLCEVTNLDTVQGYLCEMTGLDTSHGTAKQPTEIRDISVK